MDLMSIELGVTLQIQSPLALVSSGEFFFGAMFGKDCGVAWCCISCVNTLQKEDTSVTFWVERIFFCHAYDTSMTIIVKKPGIIIDVLVSYFYDKKS